MFCVCVRERVTVMHDMSRRGVPRIIDVLSCWYNTVLYWATCYCVSLSSCMLHYLCVCVSCIAAWMALIFNSKLERCQRAGRNSWRRKEKCTILTTTRRRHTGSYRSICTMIYSLIVIWFQGLMRRRKKRTKYNELIDLLACNSSYILRWGVVDHCNQRGWYYFFKRFAYLYVMLWMIMKSYYACRVCVYN